MIGAVSGSAWAVLAVSSELQRSRAVIGAVRPVSDTVRGTDTVLQRSCAVIGAVSGAMLAIARALGAASTEPRRDRRGERDLPSAVADPPRGFNGAAP